MRGYPFKAATGDTLALVNLDAGLGWARTFACSDSSKPGASGTSASPGAPLQAVDSAGTKASASVLAVGNGFLSDFEYGVDAIPSSQVLPSVQDVLDFINSKWFNRAISALVCALVTRDSLSPRWEVRVKDERAPADAMGVEIRRSRPASGSLQAVSWMTAVSCLRDRPELVQTGRYARSARSRRWYASDFGLAKPVLGASSRHHRPGRARGDMSGAPRSNAITVELGKPDPRERAEKYYVRVVATLGTPRRARSMTWGDPGERPGLGASQPRLARPAWSSRK